MRAMVFDGTSPKLDLREVADPRPGAGQVLIRVEACGVCRTDLHVVDGDLTRPKRPLIPGHEIVGRVADLGSGVSGLASGQRVGVPWLGHTCGACRYCHDGQENLCDAPGFTGYTIDGGYAEYCVADAQFVFALSEDADPVATAPLLCAGLIGYRSFRACGEAKRSVSTASARRRISCVRSRAIRASTSTPSRARVTRPRRTSHDASARHGRAPHWTNRRSSSTRPSYSRRSAIWCPAPSEPCGRAGASSAAAST